MDTEAKTPTIAQRLGHAPLLETIGKPAVNIGAPNLLDVARSIVENLPQHLIFRQDKRFFTVATVPSTQHPDIMDAELQEMDSVRFRSWVCDYLVIQKGDGDKAKAVQMPASVAEAIMASDPWRAAIKPLEELIPVQLPVWGPVNESGQRTVRLASPGYDPRTCCYTAASLNYTENTPQYNPSICRAAWDSLMRSFPWGPESEFETDQEWQNKGGETMKGPRPCTNRSACCCLALMLGQYCRQLIDDVMPIGIFNANQPGSGKSLLAWLCVAPVWGMAAGSPNCKDEDDAIKALEAAVLNRKTYYMLDDIPVLASGTINMFATSNEVAARRLGSLDFFSVRNRMQIFATGNNIGTSEDVERRSLIIDLFLATKATKRKFKRILNKKTISEPAWRADLLRLMWSMVQNWADQGCPILVESDAMPSFENFANVVGSIMLANGFQSPFRERRYSGAGGDLIGRTVNKLLAYIATHKIPEGAISATFKLSEMIEIATANEWLQTIIGNSKSPSHSVGKHLEKLRAQKLYDENGYPYEFGKREGAGQSSYTFTRL